jgi:ribonuclease P protein component
VTGPSKAFTRASRLTSSLDFTKVFRAANRSSDRFFTVLARANEVAHARLGLAISRKAAPRAVDRNRLRRLTREAFRQSEQLAPLDFVVMASREATTAARPELRASLDRHFDRLSRRATAN